jgi:hypothetical protein
VIPVNVSLNPERELILAFARQLLQTCLERHGKDHEETRLVLGFILSFERPSPSETPRYIAVDTFESTRAAVELLISCPGDSVSEGFGSARMLTHGGSSVPPMRNRDR